jgi:hypothetical protein
MKSREPRHKVLVKARMHCGARWQDVGILNYSAHGLGLTCDRAPARGTYIEIRRGPFVIVARVAWAKGHRFGARTQDAVPHVAMVGKVATGGPVADCGAPVERRMAPRSVSSVRVANRERGRAIEFTSIAIALAAGAAVLADAAYAQLADPLDSVRAALSVTGSDSR